MKSWILNIFHKLQDIDKTKGVLFNDESISKSLNFEKIKLLNLFKKNEKK